MSDAYKVPYDAITTLLNGLERMGENPTSKAILHDSPLIVGDSFQVIWDADHGVFKVEPTP
jgi:hypothetical protein